MNINTISPAALSKIATDQNQQTTAIAVAKKGMELDKIKGEEVLQLVNSTANAGHIDVYA